MISNKALTMLKYQKTSSKCKEYSVDKSGFHFQFDYRELSLSSYAILSDYSYAIIIEDFERLNVLSETLSFICQYYENAFSSNDEPLHSEEYLFNAAISFFYNNDFGSAKVLIGKITYENIQNKSIGELYLIFKYILGLKYTSNEKQNCSDYVNKLVSFIVNSSTEEYKNYMLSVENQLYSNDSIEYAFYHEAMLAIAKIAIDNSAKNLIPYYSQLTYDVWKSYFEMEESIKILWPSQRLICEKGILSGQNAIIQLPTGVGKTRSIDLIIRSCFLSNRGKMAIIVAPLRALCNEISSEMNKLFPNANVNLVSDLLEEDYDDYFACQSESIIVCTPEKLQFILRHSDDVIKKIDLIIFDESHLFDDKSRGADYELLVNNIKSSILEKQQLIFMSAVLSNADSIAKWAFKENGLVAYDEKIKTTPKSYGFVASDNNIYYYSEDFSREDFYIPKSISRIKLKRLPREKEKVFPKNDKYDYAIYFSNRLVSNGGIAIFVPKRSSIKPILDRIIFLARHDYDFSNIINNSNLDELMRFTNYFTKSYGENSIYGKAVACGFLPHHRYLSPGLKSAIEYSIKNKLCKIIVCTSTLAQGVNVPIKYLIVTSLKNMDSFIPVRNFQNLIGRTARSGSFTEGSIIVSDPEYYDNYGLPCKKGRQTYHQNCVWSEIKNMFDFRSTEPCSSAILDLLRAQKVFFNRGFYGNKLIDSICENICDEKWNKVVKDAMIKAVEEKDQLSELVKYKIEQIIKSYYKIIGSIESEICYLLAKTEQRGDTINVNCVDDYLHTLLAYELANDEEKKQLIKLFESIFNKIQQLGIDYNKAGKSLGNINLGIYIEGIISKYQLNENEYPEAELLSIVLNSFSGFYGYSIDINLCLDWINGETLSSIMNKYSISIYDVEELCYGTISYSLSFFISNIIDYMEDNANSNFLNILKSKIKFGVNSKTKIIMSEALFDDRYIVNTVCNILNQDVENEYVLRDLLVSKKDEIVNLLGNVPTYFRLRFLNFIKE